MTEVEVTLESIYQGDSITVSWNFSVGIYNFFEVGADLSRE